MNYDDLEMAVLQGDTDKLWSELETGDINVTAPNGENLLHTAISKPDIAAGLIERGININAQDYEGKTPLHRALELEHYDVAELLIERGADVNVIDDHGRPPLSDAIRNACEDKKYVKMLLDNGADPHLANDQGVSVLDRMKQMEYDQMVELLESYLAE
ncbi:ankyrin repeat domain-containing protein [Halobacterium salinarum]|uniref:ankyrin repeat domain-containing protein n=1 Tax=Halobacterium salinarum TaxID=2242 RepID=UPI0025553DAC|nr:ankyrin repeat domain-containing protein [Halobacterium salinarum]MDL0124466.1 ankyrin repeat domain-containing protein [Halobacterium salinarum]